MPTSQRLIELTGAVLCVSAIVLLLGQLLSEDAFLQGVQFLLLVASAALAASTFFSLLLSPGFSSNDLGNWILCLAQATSSFGAYNLATCVYKSILFQPLDIRLLFLGYAVISLYFLMMRQVRGPSR